MLVMGWAGWRHRNPPVALDAVAPSDLKEFGPAATNRWLRGLRMALVLLLVTVLGFHTYWVYWADSDEQFASARRLDARNRRLAESGLKGWVLDRSGKLENALIRYRADAGIITREYPLGAAAVHVTGYSDFIFGAGGMEHAFRDWLTEPTSIKNRLVSAIPVGRDLKVSIDLQLQKEAFNLVKSTGKPTGAIVLLMPNNEVLAMATAPSFEPSAITDEDVWRRLSDQAERAPLLSPLVNRALGTMVTGGAAFYYRPGSTFKTFITAVAVDSGITNETFICREEGFTPPSSGRPIRDFGGHVHGAMNLQEAFRVSCNQYFAQLGLKLGRERLSNYARRMNFAVSPDDKTLRATTLWQVEHGDASDFNFIFAPPVQRVNFSSTATPYDVSLQSIGQGFADLTVLEMALIAATAASGDGAFVAPTFEVGAPRKVIGQFISPQSAAQVRALMRMVVESGTAAGAFAPLAGRVTAGGKTGTADREVLVYDRSGKPVVERVDEDGRKYYKTEGWTDSVFIGVAPADNPQIAFAVIVENGGEGARAAAPLAAKLVERAAALGYVRAGGAAPLATR
jgi:cell division protein FtsI/penicillin-binding protein 2